MCMSYLEHIIQISRLSLATFKIVSIFLFFFCFLWLLHFMRTPLSCPVFTFGSRIARFPVLFSAVLQVLKSGAEFPSPVEKTCSGKVYLFCRNLLISPPPFEPKSRPSILNSPLPNFETYCQHWSCPVSPFLSIFHDHVMLELASTMNSVLCMMKAMARPSYENTQHCPCHSGKLVLSTKVSC